MLKVECENPRCAGCQECVRTQRAVGCGDQGLHACTEAEAKRAKISPFGEGPAPPPPPPPVRPSPPPSPTPSPPQPPPPPQPSPSPLPPASPDFEVWVAKQQQQQLTETPKSGYYDSLSPPAADDSWMSAYLRLMPPPPPPIRASYGAHLETTLGGSSALTLGALLLLAVSLWRRREEPEVETAEDASGACELPKRAAPRRSEPERAASRGGDVQHKERRSKKTAAKTPPAPRPDRRKGGPKIQGPRYGFAKAKRYASLRSTSPTPSDMSSMSEV